MIPLESLWTWERELEIALIAFTMLVGIGVVLEEWTAITDMWCATFEYFKGMPFDRSTIKRSAIGGSIVVLGLAGEFVVEVAMPIVETDIRAAMSGRELTAEQRFRT